MIISPSNDTRTDVKYEDEAFIYQFGMKLLLFCCAKKQCVGNSTYVREEIGDRGTKHIREGRQKGVWEVYEKGCAEKLCEGEFVKEKGLCRVKLFPLHKAN